MRQIRKYKIIFNNYFFVFIFTIFPTIFYCSSRMSFGDHIPIRIHMLFCSSGLLLFILSIWKKKIKFTLIDFNALIIILIVCVWNNWDLKNDIIYPVFIYTVLFGLFIFASKIDKWIKIAFKLIILFGMFYSFWTIITWLSPSIYYNLALPIVDNSSIYDLGHQYNKGHMSGLTAHYSTNGIYLASGICFTLGYYFFRGETIKGVKMNDWICLAVQIFALFLTGKRGPVVYLMLSFIVVYIVYNTNKPVTRFLRIFGIVVVAIIIYIVVASGIPALWNFVIRFQEEAAAGDISNGRYVLWSQAYAEFLKQPLFGHGWYWFRYNNLFGKTYYHVHNCYLQWLCELGVIGSIPFFTFVLVMFYRAIIVLRMSQKGELGITSIDRSFVSIPLLYNVYFLCACFTGTLFFEAQSLCPYILCCAYVQRLWRKYVVKTQKLNKGNLSVKRDIYKNDGGAL